jgi:putative membrane-bound dehydrogenase-like protein
LGLLWSIGAFGQPPAERDAILETFEIHPDFRLELAAMEPVVFDPVDLDFDESGVPYVLEMPDYPFATEGGGRIVRIRDRDGDGYYESREVFAEGFPLADSLLRYGDGFLVASPPHLVWSRDTNGDGTEDARELIFDGFAAANTQHNFGGLTYGLDNWVYASNGGNNGRVFAPERPDEAVPLRYNDLRMDIAKRRVELIGYSTGGFELTFDEYGRFFGTHNLVPISHLIFTGGYAADLFGPREGALVPIADDTERGLVRIYPIGAQETRVNHPEQSGYFSGSCGITHYNGGAFPAEFNGNIFIMDVVLNLVHRRVLESSGTTFVARRADVRSEFLASRDRSFRPVNATVAPDGSLWVLDMHRDVIEHPEWIPDEIEATLDLEAGTDQGRLFRIVPQAGLSPVTPVFSREDLDGTVEALSHPNGWWRTTAQRLLVEWQAVEAEDALRTVLHDSTSAYGRLHAMWTLEGLGRLDDADIVRRLEDTEAGVRENAVRLAEPRVETSADLRKTVVTRLNDDAPRVRMQAALALGTAKPTAGEIAALAALVTREPLDFGVRLALSAAVRETPVSLLGPIAENEAGAERAELVRLLSGQAVRNGQVDAALAAMGDAALANRVAGMDGMAEELERSRRSAEVSTAARGVLARMTNDADADVQRAAWRVQRALDIPLTPEQKRRLSTAREAALDASRDTASRLAQLRLLAFAPFADRAEALYALLDPRQPRELQVEAVAQCAAEGTPEVGRALIARWATLGPATRSKASDVLLYRRDNHEMLLDAIEDGTIVLGEMNFHLERRRTLLFSRDENVRTRAERLFSDAGVVTRRAALDEMRPALELEGDPFWGRQVYQERCAQCHRVGDDGTDLGPNLTEIFRKSAETLLHDIVDPNAAVDEAYMSYSVETTDGELYTGMVIGDTDEAVTLRDATGLELRISRDRIADFRATGLSLMPEDLQLGLDAQSMADLLAFLQEPR